MANKILPLPLFDTLEQLEAVPTSILPSALPFAITDYQQAHAFLYSYRHSPATFNAYRREVERLLQWCWLIAEKSLKAIGRAELEIYIEFCLNPPRTWIGIKKVPRFMLKQGERRANPDWRPFVATVTKVAHRNGEKPDKKTYQLSPKALQEIFTVCSSFYQFLLMENYAAVNPVSLIRQKSRFIRKQQVTRQIRRLSELQWAYVIETAERMVQENSEYERTLFIMTILYSMYLRISELAASARWQPQMGHFFRDHDEHWWFTTVGKGNKQRQISVSDEMLTALKRWRNFLNLTPLPPPNDTAPLLPKARGFGPITSTRQISTIVQSCFDKAINRLIQDGFQEDAEQLMHATVHWLRHTGISDDVKIRPREHVRDDAGHSSSAITDRYIDIGLRERHASARKKRVKPD